MDGVVRKSDGSVSGLSMLTASSDQIINSLLAAKIPEGQQNSTLAQDDDRDDFERTTEYGGVGSEIMDENEAPIETAQIKKTATNNKLLELLGKKAQLAHRKSQEAKKGMSSAKHAAPKPVMTQSARSREAESDDEDEVGRSAILESRQSSRMHKRHMHDRDEPEDADKDLAVAEETGIDGQSVVQPATESRDKGPLRPTTRKSIKKTSYLDELLDQKKNKKAKRKS